jgi:pPIWI_RE module N-terminal domain/RNaseH domain of pPIWI_RE/MID domain of pPIWI_RE
MYSLIRSTAYEPDPAAGAWVEGYHVITFAERWRTELMDLYKLGWKSREQPVSLPITQLNALLRAVAPGVVATGRGAGSDTSVPWIYAREKVPTEVVAPLFTSWVMALRPESEHEEALLRVLESVRGRTPEWVIEPVDLTATTLSPGGTAQPDRRLYSLLPEIVAACLAARPFHSKGVERDLRFRVVDRNQGAELVSWPPQEYVRAGRTWYYSAVVTITLQTVPFTGNFRVHVSTGIRRWATGAPVYLPSNRGATVLLDIPLPWPGDVVDQTPRLISNSMAYSRQLGRVDWRAHSMVDILPELDIVRVYPKPEDLLAAPADWIGGQGGVAAGIVHSTAMGTHQVGAGLMPAERARLDAWVEESLRPLFRRVPDLAKVFRTNRPVLLPTVPSGDAAKRAVVERRVVQARREALLAGLDGQSLEIDIVWQFPETRDRLVASLGELLGLPAESITRDTDQHWHFGGLRFHIRTLELGSLGSALDVPRPPGLSRAVALGEAIRARRAAVAARFGRPMGRAGLAIVEICGERRFTKPDSDPKFALRLGFADAGRLSQFIRIPDDSTAELAIRTKWTWLDGFRQLGAVTIPECRVRDGLPDGLQYVALWVVRRRADGPTRQARHQLVALRVRPGDIAHPVQGWDDARKEWVPYPLLLLNLACEVEMDTGAGEGAGPDERRALTAREQREDIERRIRSVLYQVRDRPTLLFANAGNLRDSWRWLGNGSLVKDMLGFAVDGTQRLAAYGDDLRFMLIRDRNNREEVPQWYAPGGDNDTPGFGAGLWAPVGADEDNRVFASTADVPSSAARHPRGLLKLGPHPDWPTAPSKTAWNPQYLELIVLGCLSAKALADAGRDDVTPDRPAMWAAIAHQLRFHDDYEPLSRPLLLHLAKLAEEYVLPIEPEAFAK